MSRRPHKRYKMKHVLPCLNKVSLSYLHKMLTTLRPGRISYTTITMPPDNQRVKVCIMPKFSPPGTYEILKNTNGNSHQRLVIRSMTYFSIKDMYEGIRAGAYGFGKTKNKTVMEKVSKASGGPVILGRKLSEPYEANDEGWGVEVAENPGSTTVFNFDSSPFNFDSSSVAIQGVIGGSKNDVKKKKQRKPTQKMIEKLNAPGGVQRSASKIFNDSVYRYRYGGDSVKDLYTSEFTKIDVDSEE